MGAENQKGNEIEEGSPHDGMLRAQHSRRYDCGDGIGRIMQSVEKIERKRHHDQADQERKRESNDIHIG